MNPRQVPSSVKVLGSRYRVKTVPDLRVPIDHVSATAYTEDGVYHENETIGVLGVTDTDATNIILDGAVSDDRFKVTFTHEVLHAIMGEAGLRDVLSSDTEERVVKRMAPILRLFLAENPKFYTFVTGRRLW